MIKSYIYTLIFAGAISVSANLSASDPDAWMPVGPNPLPQYSATPSSVTTVNGITTTVYQQIIQNESSVISNPVAAQSLNATANSSVIHDGFCTNTADCAAVDARIAANAANGSTSANAASNGGPTIVITTEKVPGVSNCQCWFALSAADSEGAGGSWRPDGNAACDTTPVEARKYRCEVQKGMVSFQNMIREVIRWVVYMIMLLGVLALVGAGILWAMGSDSEEYTKKAKGWAKNIVIGLILLFTFRYVLGFLAPWIFQ